jgi:hypothetical protein
MPCCQYDGGPAIQVIVYSLLHTVLYSLLHTVLHSLMHTVLVLPIRQYDGGSVIQAWARTPLVLADAVAHGLPISRGYFHQRTPSHFEYMRDHMGYR